MGRRQPSWHRMWVGDAAQQFLVDDLEAGQLRDGACHVGAEQDAADHLRGNPHHLGVQVDVAALCCGGLPAPYQTLRLLDHDVDVIASDAAPREDRRQEPTLSVPALVFACQQVLAQLAA